MSWGLGARASQGSGSGSADHADSSQAAMIGQAAPKADQSALDAACLLAQALQSSASGAASWRPCCFAKDKLLAHFHLNPVLRSAVTHLAMLAHLPFSNLLLTLMMKRMHHDQARFACTPNVLPIMHAATVHCRRAKSHGNKTELKLLYVLQGQAVSVGLQMHSVLALSMQQMTISKKTGTLRWKLSWQLWSRMTLWQPMM